MRVLLTMFLVFILSAISFGQNKMARLQVIHNAADPATEVVDVYVNGKILLDDFKFRTATSFVDVPAEIELNIGVAPASSEDSSDIIANFPVTLANGGTYVVVANGILSDGFAPNPDGQEIQFKLFARDNVKEKGTFSFLVDALILHGATDAPAVDILVSFDKSYKDNSSSLAASMDLPQIETFWGYKWLLANDISYGDFKGYKRLLPTKFILDITPAEDNLSIVASFKADLSGLGGGAAVVFASGFLTPDANNDGPAFGLFAALPNGAVVELPMIPMEKPMARLQVIHNAADPAAKMVDVYVNGKRLLDDFKFRTATPFIDVPAEVELKIGIAPADSKGAGDIIATFPVTLADGGSYIAVANGVLGDGFAPNPDGKNIAFTLFATDGARETAMEDGKVDLNVLHGSTDAPTVDVIARDVAKLVDDAMYGDFTGYIPVMPGTYILDITPGNDNETVVASFNADLSGLGGGAAVVFASGFLTPDANNDGPAFGLFAALPNGAVVELPMIPMEKPMARLQVIHNAADPAAKMVDVYVNGKRLLDDFKFRTATPFIDVPAEVELKIGIAPADSKGAGDIIATFPVTLADGGSYIAVANGVLGDGFAPNPDGKNIAFTLFATDGARETAMEDDMVDIKVLHGATDAQGVNILGYGIVIKNAMYGDITDYVSVKARKNWLVVYVPKPSLSLVGVYKADLSGLGGGAAFVFASGFINPDANNNGPSFGLYAALPNGEVVELPELFSNDRMDIMNDIMLSNGFEEITSINGSDNNTVISDYQLQQNYPNPFNPSTKIRFSLPEAANVSLKIYDLTGRLIANLVDGMKSAGQHEIDYNASDLASGIYLYILQAGDFSQIKRMTLLK